MVPVCLSAQGDRPASAPAISLAPSPAKPACTSRSVGAIEIADNFSLVEVPESLADEIIGALKATMIRGKKVNVRRERTA